MEHVVYTLLLLAAVALVVRWAADPLTEVWQIIRDWAASSFIRLHSITLDMGPGWLALIAAGLVILIAAVVWLWRTVKGTKQPTQEKKHKAAHLVERGRRWMDERGWEIEERQMDQLVIESREGDVLDEGNSRLFDCDYPHLVAWAEKDGVKYAVETLDLVFRSIHPGVLRQERVPLLQVRVPMDGPVAHALFISFADGFALLGPEWLRRFALIGDIIAMDGPLIRHPDAQPDVAYPRKVVASAYADPAGLDLCYNVGRVGIEEDEAVAWLDDDVRRLLLDLGEASHYRIEAAAGPTSTRVILSLESGPAAWEKAIDLALHLHKFAGSLRAGDQPSLGFDSS
jgi:hypothetical protein